MRTTFVLILLQAVAIAQGPAVRKHTLRFDSPTPGQAVSGNLHLAISGDLSNVATVEYRMGNYRIAESTRAPFTLDWNSALASDGTNTIEAIARDAFGQIVSDTAVSFLFQNYGSKAELLNGGLPDTLTGTVPLTLHAYDPLHFPAYWAVSIDGELITTRYTDNAGVNDNTITQGLDTTVYPNGTHEFYFTFHSNDFGNPKPVDGNENYRGMFMRNVTIDNGRTFMEVAADYLHIYTTPGSTVAVGCSRLYTNGDRDACLAPQYSAADPTIAAPDSAGNLKALREGFTDIAITEGGKTTTAHVWVKNNPGIPHFTANGGMSTTYTDGQSTFIVAPFLLAPQSFQQSATLLADVKRAGINTLTRGIYLNPLDISTTYAAWKQSFDALSQADYQFAAANGLRMIGAGDDIARNIGTEAWRTLNWPPAKQAIQYAMQQFAQSGTAVSIEMIDEASFLWGPNPQPPGLIGAANSMQSIACSGVNCTVTWPGLGDNSWHDSISAGLTFVLTGNPQLNTPVGKAYTVRNVTSSTFDFTPAAPVTATFTPQNAAATEFQWFARAGTCSGAPCNPPVPNSALPTIASWLKGGLVTVPISFPAGGIALTPTQRNWMGVGSLSDYASHYWDTNQQRSTYVFGKGIRETTYYMLSSFYNRQPFMKLDRPQLILIGISGINFLKNTPAGSIEFNPPADRLLNVASVPKSVASSMFAAAAAGVTGLRLYQFEDENSYQGQKTAGPGVGIQVSAAPVHGDTALWRAMGYGANMLTKVLQPYLLGTPLNSPALGRNIVTAVRQAAGGKMLMIVNSWDGPRDLAIDFRPYKSGGGAARYRVNDTYIKTDSLADSDGETVRLESGETLIYLFPDNLETITFQPPDSAAGSKIALRYGYVYRQNVAAFGDALDCTDGCSISVDRRIGEVFYQYTLIDPMKGISGTGEGAAVDDQIQLNPILPAKRR